MDIVFQSITNGTTLNYFACMDLSATDRRVVSIYHLSELQLKPAGIAW